MIPCLKTRIFEVMTSGAMLLEDWGSEAAYLFEDGKDYVTYHNKEELVNLIGYYLAHSDERERIARSGHDKATTIYNATNLWGYVFERCGFTVPDSLATDRNFVIHKKIMGGF
jgi:spore maturation protein CgeB